ncbi:sortase [Rubrobacter tropicus]|uniref:Sortase n=1 Tax=Rubrobacter tropicus TaxID=2653851 RepID=A0A6G8Q5P3_9ACTN|nr:sortase [Rubrobacter tropicus]QIN81786.1 sortase [Rubrobacter tropicus]
MLLKLGFVMMALAAALTGVVIAVATQEPPRSVAARSAERQPAEPLERADPAGQPQREKQVAAQTSEEPEAAPKDQTEPEPLPDVEGEPPKPTAEDVASAHRERHYDLPDGAVLGLTVKALGIHDAPVFDSVGERALAKGVGHHPETSMPWTEAPQRNVYLAGHKLGFPGTASHLIFYRLGELGSGDEVVLKDRDGRKYRYEVSESFEADPGDSWAMGQVRNRDMLTLQTCTGPGFSKRLIVRADRV